MNKFENSEYKWSGTNAKLTSLFDLLRLSACSFWDSTNWEHEMSVFCVIKDRDADKWIQWDIDYPISARHKACLIINTNDV